jgi:glycosyltransferase involved in cell wall biosynthesis
MSRPRVLFVTTSYPTEEEPATGVFVLEHARAAARHADVAVLHLERRHDARGISIRRDEDAELPTWRARYPYRPTALSVAAHVAAGLAGYRAVRRAGFDPDLVHAHFFLSALPAALLPRPMVETEHWTAFLPEDPTRMGLPLKLAARLVLRRARTVMPVSESLAAAMRDAGVRARFVVVPNAVDTSLFHPGAGGGGRRLVTVGLLQHQKGVDVLLRAFARVREQRPDTVLDVVGDGPERSAYEALSSTLGLGGAAVFHGYQPKPAIAELLAGSDLFVLASRFDNNPCVLVEAQAAGLPIVASRVGGIPEIVEGNGLLAEPGDVDALASRILDALAGLDAYDRSAIAAQAKDRFDVERVGRMLADVYASALGKAT